MVMAELAVIERYLDEVPRANSVAHDLDTVTIFTATSDSFSYYARPRRSRSGPVTPRDIDAAVSHQAEHAQPQAVEWVEELAPELAAVATSAGLVVRRYPLMLLRSLRPRPAPSDIRVRIVAPEPAAVALVTVTIGLGFRQNDTLAGELGTAERDQAFTKEVPDRARTLTEIASGRFVLASAEGESGPVGGGSLSPRGGVAEITGVSTLPAFRRRGIGAAITSELAIQALRRGVSIVFLSANSAEVAHLYGGLGFERIGTSCAATPD